MSSSHKNVKNGVRKQNKGEEVAALEVKMDFKKPGYGFHQKPDASSEEENKSKQVNQAHPAGGVEMEFIEVIEEDSFEYTTLVGGDYGGFTQNPDKEENKGEEEGELNEFVLMETPSSVGISAHQKEKKFNMYASSDVYAMLKSRPNDRDLFLSHVEIDGMLLALASPEIKNDKGVVLAAVKKNGLALEYADSKLKVDLEIVTVAVKQNGIAKQFADKILQTNPKVLEASSFKLRQKRNQHPRTIGFFCANILGMNVSQPINSIILDAQERKSPSSLFHLAQACLNGHHGFVTDKVGAYFLAEQALINCEPKFKAHIQSFIDKIKKENPSVADKKPKQKNIDKMKFNPKESAESTFAASHGKPKARASRPQ